MSSLPGPIEAALAVAALLILGGLVYLARNNSQAARRRQADPGTYLRCYKALLLDIAGMGLRYQPMHPDSHPLGLDDIRVLYPATPRDEPNELVAEITFEIGTFPILRKVLTRHTQVHVALERSLAQHFRAYNPWA